MAMRMSGLMSGMDTESIIQELVSVKQTKIDTVKKQQTKLSWKQDAWKSLNTKLKNLQSKYLGSMRFSSSYSIKTSKVSNTSAVSVLTGENAVDGVQTLKVKQLAKTGYLTGAQISKDQSYTAMSKLSDLTVGKDAAGNDVKYSGSGTFTVKTGDTEVNINVDENTTISDVLTSLKSAGLNASFDAKNQRFFVSSKESGADNDFSLTASNSNGANALSALGLQVSLSEDNATKTQYQTMAGYYVAGDRSATLSNMQSMIDASVNKRTDSYLSSYKSAQSSLKAAQDKIAEINAKYSGGALNKTSAEYQTELDAVNETISNLEDSIKNETDPEQKAALQTQLDQAKTQASELKEKKADAATLETMNTTVSSMTEKIANIEQYINVTETTDDKGNPVYSATATSKLQTEEENAYYAQAEYASKVMDGTVTLSGNGATKVSGQNAVIELNGATFENNTNVFDVNGLTFTALSETAPGETVTVTTQNDTDGIYDMIKNFFKEYNSIINEMDKLYNADSAKDYNPLTSEEKDAMSDSEVEEYEKKIKDALLRRDSNLNTISSALKSAMSAGVTVNGKTMHLADFGINTLSYFSAADNEKNAYHIDGDADDADSSGNADVLKGMIASDPSTVVSFFSQLSQSLYTEMSNQSKSVDGYRSFGNFYDDKRMATDYTDYKSKIAELEEKMNDYEDKWYSKFSKMETALAKLQSNTSAVTSLLGG